VKKPATERLSPHRREFTLRKLTYVPLGGLVTIAIVLAVIGAIHGHTN